MGENVNVDPQSVFQCFVMTEGFDLDVAENFKIWTIYIIVFDRYCKEPFTKDTAHLLQSGVVVGVEVKFVERIFARPLNLV